MTPASAPRRNACPNLIDPMPTGDGLLARFRPCAPIPIDAFIALCQSSQRLGNGIIEITQRGSLQIRGLSSHSAPLFARRLAAIGIDHDPGVAIATAPLPAIDDPADEAAQAILSALRAALRGHEAASLSPKASVLIDGNSTLHLDALSADVRVRVTGSAKAHLAIAGDAQTATSLGWLGTQEVVSGVLTVLRAIAQHGSTARARDLVSSSQVHALRARLGARLVSDSPPQVRAPCEPVGTHPLGAGTLALGIALAFGYSEARALKHLAGAAARQGASLVRPALGRALLFCGLTSTHAQHLAADAKAQGFIVDRHDPRRAIVACAGAPACGSATLRTRELAPQVAQALCSLHDGSVTLHLSGCAKGCAHPGVARLTLVGPHHLIVNGRAGDPPQHTITPARFVEDLRQWLAPLKTQAGHG